MIEAGGTDREAASAAANVTVNFNRRGELGHHLSALYLFFNPNVQGTQVLLDTLLNSPHKAQAWALAGSMVGLAFLLAGLARSDDDGEEEWRKIPGHVKDRNLILTVGEKQFTVPVPYGYGAFWALGNVLSDMAHGEKMDTAGLRLASALFDHFSPIGNPLSGNEMDIRNVVDLMPTATQIPLAVAVNRSGLGTPIMPENTPWNPGQPDSQRQWRSTTGSIYDDIAVGLNRIGGNTYESGYMDVSPETLKHLWRSFFGGSGQFVADTLNWGKVAAQGELPTLKETPIFRKFLREETVQDARTEFNQQANQVKEAVGAFNAAKRAKDIAGLTGIVQEKAELIQLGSVLNRFNRLIQAHCQAQEHIHASEMPLPQRRLQLRQMEQQEEQIYDAFYRVFETTTAAGERRLAGG